MINTFSASAIQQIRRVVRTVLREEFDLTGPTSIGKSSLASWVGIVTSQISARSGTTPGSGSVRLYDTTATLAAKTTSTGANLATVTAYSLSNTAVAVNSYVNLLQDQISGKYWALPSSSSSQSGLILAYNNSGADRSKYDVMSVGAKYQRDVDTDLELFQTMPFQFLCDQVTQGAYPTGHWGRWCVLQEDITDGTAGLAMVQGLTAVNLDTTGAPTTGRLPYVDIESSGYEGLENWFGAATLLEAQTNSGATARWGIIQMHEWQAPIYRATASGAITAGSSGTCAIQDDLGSTGKSNVTVHNNWMEGTHDIASADELLIRFNRDQNQWQIVSAEC